MDKYYPIAFIGLLVLFEWRHRSVMLLYFAVSAFGAGINGLLFAVASWVLLRPALLILDVLDYGRSADG